MAELSPWMPLLPAPGLMASGDVLHLFVARQFTRQGGSGQDGPASGGPLLDHFTSPDGFRLKAEAPVLNAAEGAEWERDGVGGVQIAAGHGYRMLYTAFGPASLAADGQAGGCCSAIGLAESADLFDWRRCGREPVLRPTAQWYETAAAPGARPLWGDPFVLYDRERQLYRAYLSARRRHGGEPATRGCVATALSSDMVSWHSEPPVFAPGRFEAMGAPMVLQGGRGYHLLFHLADGGDRVRIARAEAPSAGGPFEPAAVETFFCGRGVCVRPVILGDDDALIFVHRVGEPSAPPGSCAVCLWPALLRFDEHGVPRPMLHRSVKQRLGEPLFQIDSTLESEETMVRLLPRRGEDLFYSADLMGEGAQRVGLLFHTSITGRDNNTLWLDLERERLSLHRGVIGAPLLAAPCPGVRGGEVRLAVATAGPLAAVYLNDSLLLSGAFAGRRSGGVGLAVDRGKAEFKSVTLRPLMLD